MKLFLQIGLTQRQTDSIGNQYLHYASSLSSDMMGTDLDSQSEPMIAEMVTRMIHRSRQVFLFVHVNDGNVPLGVSKSVFDMLLESHNKVAYAVMFGNHRTAESTLNSFRGFSKEDDPARIKQLILEFSKLD